MYIKKTQDMQLENVLEEYFKKRSFFLNGQTKGNKSSFSEHNKIVHQKFMKNETPIFEFNTFCSMTGLHGFLHFVENNFNKIGKFFWALCLVAIYILCGISIYILITSFQKMPAINSLDNSVSPIWTIPFPAITVCSSNIFRPSVYKQLNLNSTDSDDQLIINTMNSFCEYNPNIIRKTSEEYLNGIFISQMLKNMSIPCKMLVFTFTWLEKKSNDPCNVWFQETFTLYGLCHSFNMMPMGELLNGVDEWSNQHNYGWKNYRSNWQPDTGYNEDVLINNHLPMRVFGSGDFNSATMVLNIQSRDLNKSCTKGMEVFYLIVHSPAEWPDMSHPTLVTSSNMLATMSITPIVHSTSPDLIPWDPEKRRCYFQNEKKLKYFKVYTQKNCILECQSSIILAQCGCVPYFYIRITNTPVCGAAKTSCWKVASQISSDSCNCLPGCSELYFKISSMNVPVEIENTNNYMSGMLFLSAYYQNKNYIGVIRLLTFTFGQFLGNVGGIMGLCLGFSFLSLAEIIYFITLRPLVNYFNLKKKMKKINPIRNIEINSFAYME